MASMVASTRAHALVGCAAALALGLVCQAAHAQPAAKDGILFDLPAQPLKKALALYDARANLSVFFPSELAEGKTSSAVHGVFTPEEALRRLLDGTGLAVQTAAAEAFVLVPSPAATPDGAAGAAPGASARMSANAYESLVQARIFQALCKADGAAFGSYRMALRVQVGTAGQVRQASLLDTTGNRARDAAILGAVRQLDIGQAPADPARPFVLLVRPRPGTASTACAPLPITDPHE